MKNLRESHRKEPEISPAQPGAEIISLEDRQSAKEQMEQRLIPKSRMDESRACWAAIQIAFVDEPRKAVQDADALVLATIKQISEALHNEREQLEKQWAQGGDASTEDLRMSFQRYRTFLDRLLSL